MLWWYDGHDGIKKGGGGHCDHIYIRGRKEGGRRADSDRAGGAGRGGAGPGGRGGESDLRGVSSVWKHTNELGRAGRRELRRTSEVFSVWKYKKEFNPPNFLNEKEVFQKNPNLAPFSIGLRACPGENIAKMYMFFVFANLFRRFNCS